MDLIAKREGVEPQLRKKWSKILGAFGALAFAIAPLHSTFIRQIDGASCQLPSGMSLDIALCLVSARCQGYIARATRSIVVAA